jgi:hypothetical protein
MSPNFGWGGDTIQVSGEWLEFAKSVTLGGLAVSPTSVSGGGYEPSGFDITVPVGVGTAFDMPGTQLQLDVTTPYGTTDGPMFTVTPTMSGSVSTPLYDSCIAAGSLFNQSGLEVSSQVSLDRADGLANMVTTVKNPSAAPCPATVDLAVTTYDSNGKIDGYSSFGEAPVGVCLFSGDCSQTTSWGASFPPSGVVGSHSLMIVASMDSQETMNNELSAAVNDGLNAQGVASLFGNLVDLIF